MKLIIKKEDEVVFEFELSDEQIHIAEELSIPLETYLIEHTKIKLAERRNNEPT
jgi:hypothetical protein